MTNQPTFIITAKTIKLINLTSEFLAVILKNKSLSLLGEHNMNRRRLKPTDNIPTHINTEWGCTNNYIEIWNNIIKRSSTPFGVGDLFMNNRRFQPTAIHVKPYRAEGNIMQIVQNRPSKLLKSCIKLFLIEMRSSQQKYRKITNGK